MRFYIASGLENFDNVRSLAARLKSLGHEQTYDWTKHGSVQNSPALWPEVSQAEVNGVLAADLVIVLLPGARGTHAELGLAIANTQYKPATRIFVAGRDPNERTCVFYHHPFVTRVAANGEAVEDVVIGALV